MEFLQILLPNNCFQQKVVLNSLEKHNVVTWLKPIIVCNVSTIYIEN